MKPLTMALASAMLAGMAATAAAHMPPGHEETIEVLQHQAFPGLPGKQAVMLKVSYAPGTSSAGHTHPGPVYAYVLEGEVESQMAGGAPVVYRKGQSWYEAPGAGHLLSRNASKTKPATLLVWMVAGEHEEPVQPLPQPAR
jgi:quercetin dioxygenase-like cupin family protein